MMLKIKQIGMLLVTMSAMLVLFAGCGDKDDGGDKESLATLVAETVSSSTTTNKISTQGPSGITFEATIVSQGGDAEWCSFDLNKQVSSAGGNVGDPAYLYLDKNNSDDDRTARIDVTYTNGYSTSLTLTQRAAGFIDYDRSWGEQPEYRSDDAYIYKTYYATFVSNQFFPGGKLRNYSVCYDVDRHISHWVAYPIFKKVYETPVLSRVNDFNYDPNDQLPVIPTRDQQYIGTGGNGRGYGAWGYDRGHMLPQASRYNNYEPNRMTYYGTNMMPQNSTLNQNIWASLEGKVRGWGGLQTYDTLYVVTGAAFKSTKTIDNANGPIAVPSHCWKVLLRQRGNQNRQISQFKADELKAIGFVFTNDDAGAATSIESAVRSVKEIEELTGFKFFRNLDPAVADAVKSQKNLADWKGL
jgi:DNA/RNA non-specific endonuclease